jgi:hypothetical protein
MATPQKPRRDLTEYDPDFSPAVAPQGGQAGYPPSRVQTNAWGCLRDSIAIIVLGLVVAGFGLGAYWYLFIREAGDTTENVVSDVLDSLFGSGQQVTTVNVRQMILAVRQEAWLETVRETQALDVYAEIGMPSPLPGTRSMRYQAFVTVTAGVDMELLQEDDFMADGTTLTVTLPNAQLKDCILDQDASRFYDRSCNLVGCGNLEDILVSRALDAAATENTERLYQEAFENASEYLQDLGQNLGFEQVTVQRDSANLPPVAQGGTCAVIMLPTPTPDLSTATP